MKNGLGQTVLNFVDTVTVCVQPCFFWHILDRIHCKLQKEAITFAIIRMPANFSSLKIVLRKLLSQNEPVIALRHNPLFT